MATSRLDCGTLEYITHSLQENLMKYTVMALLSLISMSTLHASYLEKTQEKTSLVPLGMGVMQICFTPFEHDQKVKRIIKTIQELLKHANVNQKIILNTALIYGMEKGDAEKLLAEALIELSPAELGSIVVVTWVGLDGIAMEEESTTHELMGPESMYAKENAYDQFIDGSFINLGIEKLPEIELWVGLHRINPRTPLTQQIKQLQLIEKHSRVSKIGLSEVSLPVLRKCKEMIKLGFLETELSFSRKFVIYDGILDYCNDNGITFLAYSPLDRGIWTSKVDELKDWLTLGKEHPFLSQLSGWNQEETVRLNSKERETAVEIAKIHKTPLSTLALAWIIRKGGIPIPDSTSPERSASNFNALKLDLTNKQMETLDTISILGKRYK